MIFESPRFETESPNIGYLLYNGLGDGEAPEGDAAQLWWKFCGETLTHRPVDWYSTNPYTDQLNQDVKHLEESEFDRVIVIGSSAGAQHALHLFDRLQGKKDIRVVLAHGWVKPPITDEEIRVFKLRTRISEAENREKNFTFMRKLLERGKCPSPRFIESTELLREETLPKLVHTNRNRILLCRASRDMVVPESVRLLPTIHGVDLMDGVTLHETKCFGHKSAFLRDIARVSLIRDFAHQELAV